MLPITNNYISKRITKSISFINLERFNEPIKGKKTLKLKADTLHELQLLSEVIFPKDNLEIVSEIKFYWSWKHLKKIWTVKVKRIV
jgi:hypothetical protein